MYSPPHRSRIHSSSVIGRLRVYADYASRIDMTKPKPRDHRTR